MPHTRGDFYSASMESWRAWGHGAGHSGIGTCFAIVVCCRVHMARARVASPLARLHARSLALDLTWWMRQSRQHSFVFAGEQCSTAHVSRPRNILSICNVQARKHGMCQHDTDPCHCACWLSPPEQIAICRNRRVHASEHAAWQGTIPRARASYARGNS